MNKCTTPTIPGQLNSCMVPLAWLVNAKSTIPHKLHGKALAQKGFLLNSMQGALLAQALTYFMRSSVGRSARPVASLAWQESACTPSHEDGLSIMATAVQHTSITNRRHSYYCWPNAAPAEQVIGKALPPTEGCICNVFNYTHISTTGAQPQRSRNCQPDTGDRTLHSRSLPVQQPAIPL